MWLLGRVGISLVVKEIKEMEVFKQNKQLYTYKKIEGEKIHRGRETKVRDRMEGREGERERGREGEREREGRVQGNNKQPTLND